MAAQTYETYDNFPVAFRPIVNFFMTPLIDPRQQSDSLISLPSLSSIFSFSRKKKNSKEYIYFKDFHDIPFEFLEMICKYLEPSDIFALTGVCRNLRTQLLDIESPRTQALWRNSREQFCKFLDLPPPRGMLEQDYCLLTALERGCQFCNQRKQWVKVDWTFRVRTCEECFVVRFVNNSKQKRRPIVDREELRQREHCDRKRLEFFIDHRRQRVREIMEELEYETLDDNESIKSGYSGRSSNNGTFKYDSAILRKCPTYSEERNRATFQPFTKKDEIKFRQQLDYEYQVLSKPRYKF